MSRRALATGSLRASSPECFVEHCVGGRVVLGRGATVLVELLQPLEQRLAVQLGLDGLTQRGVGRRGQAALVHLLEGFDDVLVEVERDAALLHTFIITTWVTRPVLARGADLSPWRRPTWCRRTG
jgi:hypothetical protein